MGIIQLPFLLSSNLSKSITGRFYLSNTLLTLFTFEVHVIRINEIHDILVNSVYL